MNKRTNERLHTFTATFALSTRAKAVVVSVTTSPDERLALARLRVEVPSAQRRRA